MMPASDSTPLSSAMTHIVRRQLVFAAVERQHLLAVARTADDEIARNLGGIEDVQRPAAVEGDVVGDVDQRRDRAQADGAQALSAASAARRRS